MFVGPLSKRLGIRPATLRKWERAGLVQPRRDPQTGYRVYSAADVRDALLARQLRRGGYLLEQIAPLIAQVRSAGGVAPLESMLRDWHAASRPGAAPCSAALPHWTPTSAADRPRPKTGRAPAPPVRRPRIRFSRQVAPADRRRRPSIGRRLTSQSPFGLELRTGSLPETSPCIDHRHRQHH